MIQDRKRKNIINDNALFDIEHALSMYAYSYCTIPAHFIYNKKLLEPIQNTINLCHIYMIGLLPVIKFIGAVQISNKIILNFLSFEKHYYIDFELKEGVSLKKSDRRFYLEDANGQQFWPNQDILFNRLNKKYKFINFKILYIGQAYGKKGSRNAIDRLLKHETLQKISLMGIPQGFYLNLLLLEIQPNNQLLTIINPRAKNEDDGTRIKAGVDKLFKTSEKEQIALYEASLIKYFSPQYNKEFKNSFPSTNLKILQDCYKKDFSSIVAEIYIDDLPFHLYSDTVEPTHYHIATHDLHDDVARKMFFHIKP